MYNTICQWWKCVVQIKGNTSKFKKKTNVPFGLIIGIYFFFYGPCRLSIWSTFSQNKSILPPHQSPTLDCPFIWSNSYFSSHFACYLYSESFHGLSPQIKSSLLCDHITLLLWACIWHLSHFNLVLFNNDLLSSFSVLDIILGTEGQK